MDDLFEEPTPEAKALRSAVDEIKDEVGRLKEKLRKELRALKKKRADSLVPSVQKTLDQQIDYKAREFKEVDSVFLVASNEPHKLKPVLKWDEIMRKHGVPGY